MKLSIVAPFLLLVIATPALCQQDSIPLGDVARKYRETKKPVHVITDEDMPQRSEPDVAPSGPTAGSNDTGASAAAGAMNTDSSGGGGSTISNPQAAKTPKAGSTGTKQDSPQVAAIKASLAEMKSDEVGLTNQIKDVEAKLAAEDDPDRQDAFKDMLKRLNASLENRKARSADLKSKLSELQSGGSKP